MKLLDFFGQKEEFKSVDNNQRFNYLLQQMQSNSSFL